MLKDTVLKQKSEKERLLSLPYVERTKSRFAKKWLDSDLIKVILGPRRAGKSVFSLMLLKERPFMYFNFDDEIIADNKGVIPEELMKELHANYGEIKTIHFDEIQNLPNWELFINRLHREGYNLILTGSNAKLLSRELATALTGRHIPIEILPFDFNEFLNAKNYQFKTEALSLPEEKAKLLRLMEIYLISGGYPEVVVKNLDSKQYLSILFDSLLFKDVVKRHNIRFSDKIDGLGSYLINNVASYYSLRKLANILDFKSGVTIEKYIGYLKEAYIVFSLSRYSAKAGERLKSPRKIYAVDNGLVTAKATQHSPDFGHLMENLVFDELIKKEIEPNRDLFYYKTRNNREVDFAIKKGTAITDLIQVSYRAINQEAEQRETKALLEAAGELGTKKLSILTWDEKKQIQKEGKVIDFVPLWEWLCKDFV
ncbi:MAG: ATP-binding protein [bacterium]